MVGDGKFDDKLMFFVANLPMRVGDARIALFRFNLDMFAVKIFNSIGQKNKIKHHFSVHTNLEGSTIRGNLIQNFALY